MAITNKVLIVIIIVSISILVLFKFKVKDKSITVFNEYDSNKTYIIDLSGSGITTRDLELFYDDVVALYPSIYPKYKKIIDDGWFYIDKTVSMDKNISRLENYYINIFNKHNQDIESLNIELNGLIISKIKVITDNAHKYNDYNITKVNLE